MIIPRDYFSWSQYSIFGRSPAEYRKRYLLGEKGFSSKEMIFGKEMALFREDPDYVRVSKDELVTHILNLLPSYPKTEYEMTAKIKIDKKNVLLLGKFDGVDLKKHIIGEDKTGKHWDQRKVDKWEQLTWYAYIYWKSVKVIPKLRLHWVETIRENGDVVATGNVKTFDTTRSIKDFISLQARINKRWTEIVAMCKSEWAKVF